MPLKFALNISTHLSKYSFLDRFEAAKSKGFRYIEMQFPYEYTETELNLARARANVNVTLINSPPRSLSYCPQIEVFGMAALPNLENEFIETVQVAIKYAQELECKTIHILAGLKNTENFKLEEVQTTYLNNLSVACKMLAEKGMTAVIEPLCESVKPQYFLDSYKLALEYIKIIQKKDSKIDNLGLLLDVYHLSMIENTTENLKEYLPYTKHVQISQAPHRTDPFTEGKINYNEIFSILEDFPYMKPIGLEYKPINPDSTFDWLEKYGIYPE